MLRLEFETKCEAPVKVAEIGLESARRRHTCAMSTSQFLSLLREDVLVGINEMRMEQVRQVLVRWYVQGFPWLYTARRLRVSMK